MVGSEIVMGILGYEPLESRIGDEAGELQLPDAKSSRSSAASCSDGPGAALIREISPGSAAEQAGLRAGDRLVAINGRPIRDAIDLMFHASEETLELEFVALGGAGGASDRANSDRAIPDLSSRAGRARLSPTPGQELGIVLEDFKIRTCNNQCVFCFIHQNPRGLRRGIYFKDGDFRMSFLHGNYITMTNLGDADYERIIEQRLSPQYVSVHTTNHELRKRMLGVTRASDVLKDLRRLERGRIQFHTQIVLCPGWNDGRELERTLADLAKLRPSLLSIAIVPLGLTGHRANLPKMEPVTRGFCRKVIAQVEPLREELRDRDGQPILFLADEFYLTAGRAAPSYRDCDVVHQLENGVGMVWDFMMPWRKICRGLPSALGRSRSVAIVTGRLGARVLRNVAGRLSRVAGLRVEIVECPNTLFGESITVSGLLSGKDFQRAIGEHPGHDLYLIPGNAVRADGEVFLDDMRLEDLQRIAEGRLIAVDGNCSDMVEAILDY
ncbi:DUF512 domain-containing protein [Candidatus Sumerlaeota bacterium]|nr:DUF512 domain-containing protein [Candidatus Sumerlaeota bacterium]